MKTKRFFLLSALALCLVSLSSFKTVDKSNTLVSEVVEQDGLIVYAKFDGKEDYGYNFVTKDKDGEEHTLTFQKVDDAVLAAFNLNIETLVGTNFKITFKRDIKITKDSDGMDDEEEINTITKLEKL